MLISQAGLRASDAKSISKQDLPALQYQSLKMVQAGIASRSGFPSDLLDDVPPARNSSARMQQVLDTLQTNGAPQSQYNRVRSLMESMPEFAEENQGRPPEAAGEATGEEVDPVDALQRLISTCYRQELFLLEIIEYITSERGSLPNSKKMRYRSHSQT